MFQLDHGWAGDELGRSEELAVLQAEGNMNDAIDQRSPNQFANEKLRQVSTALP
jgi:hypothetical protein